jgi:hypothetical protein
MSGTLRVRELNDTFRQTFQGGQVVMTRGIAALPDSIRIAILARVQSFQDFNADNDPHGEHDFGSFEEQGHKVFFKIDYYDAAMEYGSEDPADPTRTTRVLTIMLAEEY